MVPLLLCYHMSENDAHTYQNRTHQCANQVHMAIARAVHKATMVGIGELIVSKYVAELINN